MASNNSKLFLIILVAICALMVAPSSAIDIGFSPPSVTDEIIIRGVLYCKINVTLSPNGTVLGNPPRFPNATVLLQCANRVVANTTTDASGLFNIILTPLQSILQNLLNCKIVVTTPLARCNATLPSNGTLVSELNNPLTTIGSTVNGIISIVAAIFTFIF